MKNERCNVVAPFFVCVDWDTRKYMQSLKCAARVLTFSRTHVMGVLNVTPDSFSDGGRYGSVELALSQARLMVEQGASLIDIGGESTRPGAAQVSVQQELDRVCPVIERVVSECDAVVSVDTSTPAVMAEAIGLGCGLVNDVRAFSREGAIDAVKNSDIAICVMHMQGDPSTMQRAPGYDDVVSDIRAYLKQRLSVLSANGIAKERVVLDPGFGFGKSLDHNLALLRNLDGLLELGCPLLAGLSRKSMIGKILDKDIDERLYGSVSAAAIAAMKGARIVRVHDVAQTVDALKIVDAVLGLGKA